MRGCLLALCCCALIGCSPPPYRGSIVVVAGDVSADDRTRTINGATTAQLLQANAFWREFVLPRLPVNLRNDSKLRTGLVIAAREDRIVDGRIIAELDFELSSGSEPVFNAICEAYTAYRTRLVQEELAFWHTELFRARSLATSSQDEILKDREDRRSLALEKEMTKLEKDLARGFVLKVRKP